MKTEDMECDIMNRLFDLDLDELIQKIFLSLDPLSLKSSKCVSSEWFHFIQNRLWSSKPARKQLHNRLINQWKFSEPFVTEYGQGMMGVNFLVCDDVIIVCGTREARRGRMVWTWESLGTSCSVTHSH